jgi:hypothetical protein
MLIVVLLLASCTADYLDVNTDPNNPSIVTPDLILPTAQVYTANIEYGNTGRRLNDLANLMMYNWSQSDGFSWYTDEFKYNVNSSFFQGVFNETYFNALKQYQILQNLDPKYDYYKAIGKIMKAYHYQILVDVYGDVPYSEALQRGGEATPKYDDAKTIYEDLIVQLSDAITIIDNATASTVMPGADDAMFGGDMDKWKQFANSLKLRILVRQMSMTGRDAYIQTEMDAIVAEGSGFITDDVAINPGFKKEENKQNPMWNYLGYDASGTITMNNNATCATDFILDYLNQKNDPRIDRLYEKPSTGHLGVPQGLLDYDFPVVDAFVPAMVSNIGPGILKGFDMDAVIYTLAECYFNQAEAVLKGFLDGTAKDLYESGIKASFDFLGAEGATDYIGQTLSLVSYDNSSNKLEAIITQKWIALNGVTTEQAWFDYSRTGYPSNLPLSLQASTSDRPVRLFYPAGERSSNGDNVPTQPNAFTSKIFWAQ